MRSWRARLVSIHVPRFLAELTGETVALQMVRRYGLIFESCCFVPIIKNSVLLSFKLSLSVSIHVLISSTHLSMAAIDYAGLILILFSKRSIFFIIIKIFIFTFSEMFKTVVDIFESKWVTRRPLIRVTNI